LRRYPLNLKFPEVDKEVKDQFNQLVSAINQMNAGEWSKFYTNLEQITTTQKIHGWIQLQVILILENVSILNPSKYELQHWLLT